MRVRDAAGEVVRVRSGAGKSVAITWDGRGDDGAVLPDGQYEVRADATNADGVARAASAVVRIDTTPPRIKSASVVPDPFSPNDDGQDDRATLTFVPGEAGTARVSVVDAGGVVLRRLTGWASVAAAAVKVGWDGRIQGGAGLTPAPEGVAHLLIELRDRAGNPARLTRSVRLDRTLALAGVSRRTFSPNGDGVGDIADDDTDGDGNADNDVAICGWTVMTGTSQGLEGTANSAVPTIRTCVRIVPHQSPPETPKPVYPQAQFQRLPRPCHPPETRPFHPSARRSKAKMR